MGHMQTHLLRVSGAESHFDQLRDELMVFNDVLDVFSTSRPDALVVVCSGRPRPGEWTHALRAAGHTIPPRRRAGPPPDGDAGLSELPQPGLAPRGARLGSGRCAPSTRLGVPTTQRSILQT